MATLNPHERAEAELRALALAYPETVEEFPWDHSAIKVKGKTFLFLFRDDNFLSLSVKLPESGRSALFMPFAKPTEYGLGKSGWVTSRFTHDDEVPMALLEDWLEESFRAIAPKKLAGAARPDPAQVKPAPPKRRTACAPAVKSKKRKTAQKR